MSVTFSIIPVDEQFIDEDGKQWLLQNDILLPSEWVRGGRPSFREIISAIKQFPQIEIRENITDTTWWFSISNQDFHLEFYSPFSGDIDDAYLGGLRGSFDLMVKVVNELVKLCGTLVILAEGEDPILFLNTN